jgi:hemerythrin
MAFTWSSALETGHSVIDSQHKELINALNNFLAACQQGQAADKVGTTLDFLASYTKKHFSEEETLQQKSHYPDYANHRQYHEQLIKVIAELSAELKQAGATPILVNKVIRNVGEWLVSHIQQQDTKVAAHLKQTGA